MAPDNQLSPEDLAAAIQALPAEIAQAAEAVMANPHDIEACRRWADLCELRHKAIKAVNNVPRGTF